MITKLLNEVNEKIEKLNNLVQDKEYFKKLEERIEKVNNYAQEQKQEIERLNNIINKKEQFLGDNIKRLEREVVKRDNIINELKIILRQKGIEITIYDQPNYEKISGYVSIIMTSEQQKKELKGSGSNDN